MAIECHYCGNTDLKKYAYREEKVYSWYCEPCQKLTCEMQIEKCLGCGEEFEFRFDKGWNENIVCWPCQKKAMKEFFNSAETKEAFKKVMENPGPIFDYLPKGDIGKYYPVPVVYKTFDENG